MLAHFVDSTKVGGTSMTNEDARNDAGVTPPTSDSFFAPPLGSPSAPSPAFVDETDMPLSTAPSTPSAKPRRAALRIAIRIAMIVGPLLIAGWFGYGRLGSSLGNHKLHAPGTLVGYAKITDPVMVARMEQARVSLQHENNGAKTTGAAYGDLEGDPLKLFVYLGMRRRVSIPSEMRDVGVYAPRKVGSSSCGPAPDNGIVCVRTGPDLTVTVAGYGFEYEEVAKAVDEAWHHQ